ncbi:pyruvoyl-dependent arginine decarboxylase [Nocardioides sp. W7]|uniref:pyruvoyl-dependent arginine decarboxylase n=1 Tax=Nocardioides sp. W7 TaxID=2931390 RepID=UPI001FD47AC9|nr:pyruvoyl-dependent arginine decarboxylase [Nocardioides sp. W7]
MTVSPPADVSVDITVRRGTGSGRTPLAAFDSALLEAGVANLNLITLSSVIPPGSRITHTNDVLEAAHGDRLYCVLSVGHADRPGKIVWAGIGWVIDEETGKGLFVEHHAGSEESLHEQITLSLADMTESRGGGYGPVQFATATAHCTDKPVCALVVAAYTVAGWDER